MRQGNLLPRERLATVRKIRLLRVRTGNIVGDMKTIEQIGEPCVTLLNPFRGAFHGEAKVYPFGNG